MNARAQTTMRLLPAPDAAPDSGSARALVARAKLGDLGALRLLYDHNIDAVSGVCIRMMRSRERGMDAAQEAFTVAFEKLPELQDGNAFGAWCKQIAINVCRMSMRKDRWLRFVGWASAEDADYVPEPECASQSPEQLLDLQRASRVVASLPTHQRVAWNLRHLEQEPLGRIATLCGRSLASTKRDISDAEHEIRRQLGATP